MILKLRYLNCGLDVPNEVFRCVHTTVFLKPLLRRSTGLFSNFHPPERVFQNDLQVTILRAILLSKLLPDFQSHLVSLVVRF